MSRTSARTRTIQVRGREQELEVFTFEDAELR
mgnify:CR=1 FL=1